MKAVTKQRRALTIFVFLQASSPACTELEIIVMDWLGKAIGLPAEFLHCNKQTSSGGGGVIQVCNTYLVPILTTF